MLNPWLSCGPRGVDPICPPCDAGDLSLCWSFGVGPITPGIHTGTSRDASGGYAELMPAHDSMLFKVPESVLYFKKLSMVGSNAFGFEEVDGVRKHGIEHYLDLVADGRIDLTGMLTHTFELDDWRHAFGTLATQDRTGAIKVAFDFSSSP